MKRITLVIAWTLIVVPLGWGVYQSVRKSMPLFMTPPEPSAINQLAPARLVTTWSTAPGGA